MSSVTELALLGIGILLTAAALAIAAVWATTPLQ
jgi:hypothetical protein